MLNANLKLSLEDSTTSSYFPFFYCFNCYSHNLAAMPLLSLAEEHIFVVSNCLYLDSMDPLYMHFVETRRRVRGRTASLHHLGNFYGHDLQAQLGGSRSLGLGGWRILGFTLFHLVWNI